MQCSRIGLHTRDRSFPVVQQQWIASHKQRATRDDKRHACVETNNSRRDGANEPSAHHVKARQRFVIMTQQSCRQLVRLEYFFPRVGTKWKKSPLRRLGWSGASEPCHWESVTLGQCHFHSCFDHKEPTGFKSNCKPAVATDIKQAA